MAQLYIYVNGSPQVTFNYDNVTEDETISFNDLLNRVDNGGSIPNNTITQFQNNGYSYTTNNVYNSYFRFYNGTDEICFNNAGTQVTLKANTWWDAEIFMAPPVRNFHAYNYFYVDGNDYASVEINENRSTTDTQASISAHLPNKPNDKTGYTFKHWRLRGTSLTFDYSGDANFTVTITAGVVSTNYFDAEWMYQVDLTLSATSDSITATLPSEWSSAISDQATVFYWRLFRTSDGARIKDDTVQRSAQTTDSHEFSGLTKGTNYKVTFSTNGEYAYGEATISTTNTNVWIYHEGWKLATPYIYTGTGPYNGWEEAQAYIYTRTGPENGWQPC